MVWPFQALQLGFLTLHTLAPSELPAIHAAFFCKAFQPTLLPGTLHLHPLHAFAYEISMCPSPITQKEAV